MGERVAQTGNVTEISVAAQYKGEMVTIEEFLQIVKEIPRDHKGCKIWVGPAYDRYPRVRITGILQYCHRLVLEHKLERRILPGLCACHSCDVQLCVASDHLFEASQKQNMEDAARKGRTARGDRHGWKTHPESIPRGDKHGWYTSPESRPYGEKNGMSRLFKEQVLLIRKIYQEGDTSQQRIANQFNIGQRTVSDIVRYISWRDV